MGIQERRQRERERRRQQILVAAKRIFMAHGFGRATMEDVAREAELSPGTLYLYFRNKDELYASLSLRTLQFMKIRIEQVFKNTGLDPSAKFTALQEVINDVYEFDPLVLISLFQLQSSETLKNLSPGLLGEMLDLSRQALQMVTHIFTDGIEKSFFIDRNPVALTDILWAIFSGVVLWEEAKKVFAAESMEVQSALELAFDIMERGIRKP